MNATLLWVALGLGLWLLGLHGLLTLRQPLRRIIAINLMGSGGGGRGGGGVGAPAAPTALALRLVNGLARRDEKRS